MYITDNNETINIFVMIRDVQNIVPPDTRIQNYYLKTTDGCIPIYIMVIVKLYGAILFGI